MQKQMKSLELSITELRLKSRKVLLRIIQEYEKEALKAKQQQRQSATANAVATATSAATIQQQQQGLSLQSIAEHLSDREVHAFQESWNVASLLEQNSVAPKKRKSASTSAGGNNLISNMNEQWSALNFLIERFNAIYQEQFLPEFVPLNLSHGSGSGATNYFVDGGLGQIASQVLKLFEQIQHLLTDIVDVRMGVASINDAQGLKTAVKVAKSEAFSDKVITQMTQDVNTLEQAMKRRLAQRKYLKIAQ